VVQAQIVEVERDQQLLGVGLGVEFGLDATMFMKFSGDNKITMNKAGNLTGLYSIKN
jgi:hypothetical protein